MTKGRVDPRVFERKHSFVGSEGHLVAKSQPNRLPGELHAELGKAYIQRCTTLFRFFYAGKQEAWRDA